MVRLLFTALASDARTIGQRVDSIPRYDIVKTKVDLQPEDIPAALDKLESHFSAAKGDRMDGLRLDWEDRWLLIRGSNTEPIVRVIAEASSAQLAHQMCDEARAVIS